MSVNYFNFMTFLCKSTFTSQRSPTSAARVYREILSFDFNLRIFIQFGFFFFRRL